MSNDPWENRTAGMKCRTCMFFVEKAGQEADKPYPMNEEPPKRIGRCRRHAPTMNGYPVVFNNDWCGDHKLDETKL
jgi:hypothetical protein